MPVSVSEGGSRKRRKMDRDRDSRSMSNTPADADAILICSDAPAKVKVESGPSLPFQPSKIEPNAVYTHAGNCQHEASLRTLQTDLEAMRQLITCKICLRFLYEPYALTCGHTYCYSCINNWMGKDKEHPVRHKTCPDCRTVIKEQPAPSYLVKEMVLIFSNRTELLPDGETSEEHHELAKQEAEEVAVDKANTDAEHGGLFKGTFRKGGKYNPILAVMDQSDHVYRCPMCMSEIEDHWCNTCGVRVIGDHDGDLSNSDRDSMDSDLDPDSDELDNELDAELREDEIAFGFGHHGEAAWTDDEDASDEDGNLLWQVGEPFRNRRGLSRPMDPPAGEEEESDEDTDASLDGFIDDQVRYESDAGDELNDSDDTAPTPVVTRRRRGPAIVLSDDEDDDIAPAPRTVRDQSEGASSAGASRHDPEDMSDSDAERNLAEFLRRGANQFSDVESDLDQEEDSDHVAGMDEEAEPPTDDETEINLANHLAIHGYSPSGFDSDDDEESQFEGQGFNTAGFEHDNAAASEGMSERAEDSDEDGEDDESDDMSTADGYTSD